MADEENNAPEVDPQFEPVHKLTEQVAVTTGEEGDAVIFKMRAKLFRFEKATSEWKERGTGEAKILKPESGKIRLVMRRDKTLKVCANHVITGDMTLSPNIGSDRSWVWNVAADVSEGEPTQETLAIRFANAENAGLFKKAFEEAQEANKSGAAPAAAAAATSESAPAPIETSTSTATSSEEAKAEAAEKKEEEPVVAAPAAVEAVKEEEKKADEAVDAKATDAAPVEVTKE